MGFRIRMIVILIENSLGGQFGQRLISIGFVVAHKQQTCKGSEINIYEHVLQLFLDTERRGLRTCLHRDLFRC